MAINPTIGVGLTPCGLAVDAAKPFGNNALLFVLFMPKRPAGLVHHFIGTNNCITGQVQEIAEK